MSLPVIEPLLQPNESLLNVLPGLYLFNKYISRDESIDVARAVMLSGKLLNKLRNKDFIEIMKEAVDIKIEFITLDRHEFHLGDIIHQIC